MKAKRFEELDVWKLSRELVKSIYVITAQAKFQKDFSLINQIQRSSISIMSNIAEGFERKGNKEFIHFLYIAKGSCGELRSQLYIALDLDYITQDDFQYNLELAEHISKSISGFIKYLESYIVNSKS
jgi:four helix bundle protein